MSILHGTYASYYSYGMGYYIFMLLFSIGIAIVFGCITRSINQKKGYEGGFAWGFWLGWIGIIVVATRRSLHSEQNNSISPSRMNAMVQEEVKKELARIKAEEEAQRLRAERLEAARAQMESGESDMIDQFLAMAEGITSDQKLLALWNEMKPIDDPELQKTLENRATSERMYGIHSAHKSLAAIRDAYKPGSVVDVPQPAPSYTPGSSYSHVSSSVNPAIREQVQKELARIKAEEEEQKCKAERIAAARAKAAESGTDLIDQFLSMAEGITSDQKLLALWNEMKPVDDPELQQTLENRATSERMYGIHSAHKSLAAIRATYKPHTVDIDT